MRADPPGRLAFDGDGAPALQILLGRDEDVYFVDEDYGWIVNGDGEVYRTLNGGETWLLSAHVTGYLRSTGFVSRDAGWVGVLEGLRRGAAASET